MHLVPFNVTIPEAERDKELPEKLKAEWPAILGWMMQGCLAWQREGLAPPGAVRAATDEFSTRRQLGRWARRMLRERWHLRLGEQHGPLAELEGVAETAREPPGSQQRLNTTLKDRGFESTRQAGTGRMGFKGLRLRAVTAGLEGSEGL
jgi:putative DNA primase/helicase